MGASAFIFLALYCLNKDPHCFLFSKPHPQSNKLFHWKKKNTARQQDSSPCRETGGRRKCHRCTERCRDPTQSPNAQPCSASYCVWGSYVLLIMLSKTRLSPVCSCLTALNLTPSPAEPSPDAGSAEFQLLANTFISITLSSLMEKQNKSRWIMLAVCKWSLFADLCPIICEEGQNSTLEDD